MARRSKINGNHIFSQDDDTWFYEADQQPVNFSNPRPCPHCGKNVTQKGHDACLGDLPNVLFACCGHFDPDDYPYVVFKNGDVIDFGSTESMLAYFDIKLP